MKGMPYKICEKTRRFLKTSRIIDNGIYNAIALVAIIDAIWFTAISWFSFRPLILITQVMYLMLNDLFKLEV